MIAQSEAKYDDLGRVYQSIVYGVDPATGTVGNSLTMYTWYDQSSNVIKSLPAGSNLFVKTTFDSLGRPTIRYTGYDLDESTYADAFTVTGDVIMEQSETVYDDASTVIQTTARQRYHNAPDTQTGALQDPSTTPKARVTYAAMYPDGIGRTVATANYGTNGGTALSRSSTIPAAADDVLVSLVSYDSAGNVLDVTDPAGIVTRTEYDDAGRTMVTIENYQELSSSSSSSSSSGSGCETSDDTNRTTLFSYTPDGQRATMTAVNSSTTNQTTTWTYGTTLDDSEVATSILLRSITYPDSVSGSDVVLYSSNRQAQRTSLTDQRGCVHAYEYDLLGRPIHDRVTTVGSGVDDTVLRLSSAYDVRGMLAKLTSWDDASVGTGTAINEVQWTYNDFQQSIKTYQAHFGQVNTGTTANVQMGYANGSANTVRPTTLTYPNGRVLTYSYGTSGSITDASSQVASLIDSDVGATHLADYSYLGLGGVVQQDSPEADLRYTLISLTGTNDPDTGDIYAGLDQFGRVKDCRWRNTSSSTDLSRVQYGYNRDSSRIWRANPTDPNQHYDWLYSYDGLQRLKSGDRGTLNGTETAITDPQFGQCWTLDSTGNWKAFRQDDDGDGTWDLVQSRDASPVNEITDITNSVGSTWVNPAYDPAGNMTTLPQPADPTQGIDAVYDAWNRLVSLTDSTSHNTVQQNSYDGRNYRVVRKDYTGGTLSATRNFYYTDGWRDVEERLGTNPDSANPDQQYVWGIRYIDDVVCRNRSVSGTLDERLYGCQDGNWNVAAIVDSSGAVQERYEYDPYGNTTFLSPTFTVRSSSSFAWDLTYAGYRFERGSGLFNARNRFYDASLGMWINRDPAGYHDSTNLYAATFVVNGYDPYGLGDEGQITFFQMYSEAVVSQAVEYFWPTSLQFLPNSPSSMRTKAQLDRIANNILPELKAQNASWYYTTYVVVGDALGGLTAVKGIPDSLEGRTEGGGCYSTGAHIFVIGTTSVQLLGTGLGLKGNLGKGIGPNIPLPKVPNWIFLDPPEASRVALPDSHALNQSVKTPVDLTSFGNAKAPNGLVGGDFTPPANPFTIVGPESPPFPQGMSTFAQPGQSGLSGANHTFPAGTKLPAGVRVIADGSDLFPDSPHPPTHYTIYPIQKIPFFQLDYQLKKLPCVRNPNIPKKKGK